MIECLRKLGYKTIDREYYEKIDDWESWYKGKVKEFHHYSQYNGTKKVGRERATLGMAKKVCEDWANLLLNEKVSITADSDSLTDYINSVLQDNNFSVCANRLIELTFALGTGAFVEYISNKKLIIDYVRADMIYPLSWSNGKITECAFGSVKTVDNAECIFIQVHKLQNSTYVVYNYLFDKDSKAQIAMPKNVTPTFDTQSAIPMYQIISPNVVNNTDMDNPMGISIFANAIDILKGVDLVYDSYQNEFRLGKKRIIVPTTMAQIKLSEDGAITPMFDDNDTEFYGIRNDKLEKLQEIDMNIRSEEHKAGLEENLSLLADKCGLGNDRYRYNNNAVKTATEVVSEKSELYQNLRKHEIIIRKALIDLCNVILTLSGKTSGDIVIDFDDSIIEDTDAEYQKNIQLVSLGIMQPWELRAWYFNEDEKTAKEMVIGDMPDDEE